MEQVHSHAITLSTVHPPGIHNTQADSLNRYFSTEREWELHNLLLQVMVQVCSLPSTDLFASQVNNKGEEFCSRRSLGDAFLIVFGSIPINSSLSLNVEEHQAGEGASHLYSSGLGLMILLPDASTTVCPASSPPSPDMSAINPGQVSE